MNQYVTAKGMVIFQHWDNRFIGDGYDPSGYKGNEYGQSFTHSAPEFRVTFTARTGWAPCVDSNNNSNSDPGNNEPGAMLSMPPGG